MKVTFLGTGTSQGVPVIACHCPVCTSTDVKDNRLRSAVLLEYNGYSVVIDTGPDFRYQMLRQQVNRLDAVLMTHSHKDHVAGLDDVRAFNYQQQQSIPIYSTKATHEALRKEFYYAFSEHKYPGIPQLELEEVFPGIPFELYDQQILPIEVMHYKMPVLGFRIGDFAYITDAKTISEASMKALEGVQVLVLNALQKEPHISHLTMDEAIEVAQQVAAKQTYFTHISHRFGLHQDIQSWLPKDIFLAYDQLVIEI
ncbi:MBL fold metallo-hydrolase [Sphingobacterium sp. HJSM2_6]|uniref:MBL fold metallo-hydrolase n=1 Tax=Sphingobacterium sp. HJSM2_6 TaxID=3366264 RepID=UPI003BDE2368